MMKSLKIGDLLARTPIVQGGMGVGISLSGLASAVANEGGVGVISSAGLGVIYRDYSPDYNIASIWGLREELRKAREKTRGIIGVNVMVAMSNFADMVKTAIQEKADIIFSGAGLPLNLPSFLTEGCRTKLAPIVSSARAAKLLCEKWLANYGYIPDAIVVEGPKAGGHLGYKADQIEDEHYSLEEIRPPIVEEVHAFEAAHDCHIPVIAGGGSNCTETSLAKSRKFRDLGADGLLLITPYYNKANQKGMYRHFATVAEAVDLPIILYNVPGRTGCALSVECVEALSKLPNVRGIKEASGNISYTAKVARLTNDEFVLLSGNDDMIVPVLSLGGVGVVSVWANICPRQVHDLVAAYRAGDGKKALELQLKYLELINALFIEVNPIPVKEAMNMLGMEAGPCRLPLCEMEDKNREALQKALRVLEEA